MMDGPVTSGFAHRDTDDGSLLASRGSPRNQCIAPDHMGSWRSSDRYMRAVKARIDSAMRFSHLPYVDHHLVV